MGIKHTFNRESRIYENQKPKNMCGLHLCSSVCSCFVLCMFFLTSPKDFELVTRWNVANIFTGWVDVDLSEKGLGEAKGAGELLKAWSPGPLFGDINWYMSGICLVYHDDHENLFEKHIEII